MSSSTSTVKLEVRSLKAYYLVADEEWKAVDGVSFELLEGESLAIVGESACGKSTLGSSLLRSLQDPGRIIGGEVILDGVQTTAMPLREFDSQIRWKKIAMIFQGAMNALDPVYTVGTQMKEILKQHRFEGNFNEKLVSLLTAVGLDGAVLKRYPHELSGGMKQRVVIAMSLLLDPEILIADEPTTALDVLVQAQIMKELRKLKEQKGLTVILITHDLALASQIANRLSIMYAGRMVEFGTAKEIYENPKHPYTQALISAIPRLRSKDKHLRFVKGSPPPLNRLPAGCRFYERCPDAMEYCKHNDPPEIHSEGGYVRCWLYDDKVMGSASRAGPSTMIRGTR